MKVEFTWEALTPRFAYNRQATLWLATLAPNASSSGLGECGSFTSGFDTASAS
jgi:hypothetical protein